MLPPDNDPKGIQQNGFVIVNVSPGDTDGVPADWRIFVFYSHNIVQNAWPEAGTLHIESVVEPW